MATPSTTRLLFGKVRPAIVVAPGFIQNDSAFATPERSLLSALEGWGFEVISLRAFSPRKRQDRFEDYVDAAERCILSVSEQRPVAYLGHSMGGLIGVSLSSLATSRLSAMVVAGTPLFPGVAFAHAGDGRLSRSLARVHATDIRVVQRSIRLLSKRLGKMGVPFPGRSIGRTFQVLRSALNIKHLRYPLQVWAPKALDDDELRVVLKDSFSSDSFGVLADLLDLTISDGEHAGGIPTGERLARLELPLLCIAGAFDGVAPLKSCRELFDRAGSEEKTWKACVERGQGAAGHIDLLTSESARRQTWPVLNAFLDEHCR